jgi:hypothetical protein
LFRTDGDGIRDRIERRKWVTKVAITDRKMRGSISSKPITFIENLQNLSCPLTMIAVACVEERGKTAFGRAADRTVRLVILLLELVPHGVGGQTFSSRIKVLAAIRR